MTDKESAVSHETFANNDPHHHHHHHHQKSASTNTIQLPILTSKPLKQPDMKDGQDEPAPSGYYLNVAQKGKLILPTALWILLILAGVSFLTLLASLNKAVDTLDTLVELEQDKETVRLFRGAHEHHEYHERQKQQQQQQQQQQSKLQNEQPVAKHDDKQNSKKSHHNHNHHHGEDQSDREHADWLDGLKPSNRASWFAMPAWTSLEPVPKAAAGRDEDERSASKLSDNAIPSQMASLMDDMLRQIMGSAGETGASPEISGSFIISSSADGNDLQVSGTGQTGATASAGGSPPNNLIESILKQFVSSFEDAAGEPQGRQAAGVDATDQTAASSSAGPFISANIENLNINLNNANSDDDAATAGDKGADKEAGGAERAEASSKSSSNPEEIEQLEKSIDSLVSKLMTQKTTRAPSAAGDLGVDEIMPQVVGPFDLLRPRPNHRLSHHHLRLGGHDGPMSPLASLLMPMGFSSSRPGQLRPPFDTQPNFGSGGAPASFFVLDDGSSPLFGDDRRHRNQERQPIDDPQLIISITDGPPPTTDDQQAVRMPGLASIMSEPKRRPDSPYELPVGLPISSLFDSLRDFDGTMAMHSSNKVNGDNQPLDEHRPTKPSAANDAQKLKDDAKWDMLSNDLADSMWQSIMQQTRPLSPDDGTPSSISQPETIVMIDGKPLAKGDRHDFFDMPLFPMANTQAADAQSDKGSHQQQMTLSSAEPSVDSPIDDMLSLIFGPVRSSPPSPSSASSTNAPVDAQQEGESGVEKFFGMMKHKLDGTSSSTTSSDKTTAGEKADAPGPQTSGGSSPMEALSTSITPQPSDKSDGTTKAGPNSEESPLSDFIGSMFTLPQFGGGSSQQQVDTQGSSTGGSSSPAGK
jgi:hypothetical protein